LENQAGGQSDQADAKVHAKLGQERFVRGNASMPT
jgi:hypothetical protein